MEINTVGYQFIEPDSSPGQKVKRLVGYSLFFFVPLEVELPGVDWVWDVAFFVCNGKTDLNHFGFFNVAANQNIFLVLFAIATLAVLPSSSRDDAWKLGVLRIKDFVPLRSLGTFQ